VGSGFESTIESNIWENDGVIAARKLLKKNDNLQT
jgi:hypothetical protein